MTKGVDIKLFSKECRFVLGAHQVSQIPETHLIEIGFVGRSNVGKSSLMNALVKRKDLARVSKTPGRTQQLNFFNLDDKVMLVDLPGYGFAAVSKKMANAWQNTIFEYLQSRQQLRRVFLLIDGRHGLKSSDEDVMTLMDKAAVSYAIVLTKSDQVDDNTLKKHEEDIKAKMKKHTACHPDVFMTSAKTKHGIEALQQHVLLLMNGGGVS